MTPDTHLAQVLAAYGDSPNPRLAEITKSLIKHLHQFVAEVGLTREEWFAGIEALTRTGQMCDDQRQEFILMSDTIGVSMLVEMINHGAAEGSTEPTVFGPFHVGGAPHKHKTVITHLFDAASDYLDSDAVFGVRDSLVVDMSGATCEYDFVLEPQA